MAKKRRRRRPPHLTAAPSPVPTARSTPGCSLSDCHALDAGDWRETASGYEARIRDYWVRVPPQRILSQRENPTGRAVACFNETTRIIYRFVRMSETRSRAANAAQPRVS